MNDEELFARRARVMRLEPPPFDAVLAEVARRERGFSPKRRGHAVLAVAACIALVLPLRASSTPDASEESSCPLRAYTAFSSPEPLACVAAPALVCEPGPIASRL